MSPLLHPLDDSARRAALHTHDLLDVPTGPDPELDAVVRLARTVTGARTATVDLLDAHRQLRLAAAGPDTRPGRADAGERRTPAGTDRAESLGARAHTGRGPGLVVVRDARLDPRHHDSAWVDGRLGTVVFHASAPLLTPEGHLLGTLAVTDDTPRDLTGDQAARLIDLAGLATAVLDRHRRRQVALLAELEHQRAQLTAARTRLAALEQATDRLRRDNDELTHLAAVAGHDLAAPLTAVTGYLELVLDVHRDDLGAQGAQWLGTALRAAHRMQGLIEAVLVHSLTDADRCTPRPVDVRDVLRHVLEDLGAATAGAHVGYTATPAHPGGAPDVHADPVLLRQLLQNLLANALRHRHPDRPCRIEVTVTAHPAGHWELLVADNGRGIPAERREDVFTLFTSGPPIQPPGPPGPDGRAGGGGHGIGLATCRRIVARHGGTIHAEQTPGGGATLRATFAAPTPTHSPSP